MVLLTRSLDEDVREETINAYTVQRTDEGKIRIRSGKNVIERDTYPQALKAYAEWMEERKGEENDEFFRDGAIPTNRYRSDGFRPIRVLAEITGDDADLEMVIRSVQDDIFQHESELSDDDE